MNHKRLLRDRDLTACNKKIRRRCGAGRGATNGKQEWMSSGREALVAMVQPADLRDGDDFSDLARLYRPLHRAILVQGKMRPGAVIVINVRRKHPAQMVLVEDDQGVAYARRKL